MSTMGGDITIPIDVTLYCAMKVKSKVESGDNESWVSAESTRDKATGSVPSRLANIGGEVTWMSVITDPGYMHVILTSVGSVLVEDATSLITSALNAAKVAGFSANWSCDICHSWHT